MKTRKEIVQECAQAAAACWNHYADEPLDQTHRGWLLYAVDANMPQSVSTKDWQAYADEQDRLRESECMESECMEAHQEGRSRPLQDFIDELKENDA